jgi:hypothetical protein
MREVDGNLLVALDRRKIPEDFLSAAFAHLLNHLCRDAPSVATQVFSTLLDRDPLSEQDAKEAHIEFQEPLARDESESRSGRPDTPDITIKTSHHLIYLEVKRSGRLDDGEVQEQLEEYLASLERQDAGHRWLVLVSHRLPDLEEFDGRPHFAGTVLWHEMEAVLQVQSSTLDGTTTHLVEQFGQFLHEVGLALKKVDSNLWDGMNSLRNFDNLLQEILKAKDIPKLSKNKKHAPGELEYTFRYDDVPCELHLWYDTPDILTFHSNQGKDKAGTLILLPGWHLDEPWPGWIYNEVNQVDEGFFKETVQGQQQILDRFISRCLQEVSEIIRQQTRTRRG